MTIKYTKEQLNKFDKDLLIELFLGMQGQMEKDHLFHHQLHPVI